MREHVEEAEAVAESAAASPATVPLTQRGQVLALQRTAGNRAKIRARSRFSLLWDSEFILHEHRTVWADREWLLRPEVKFVDSGQHLTINLHAGRGNDDRQNWYMGSPEYVYAHEISHQMGLLDEYAGDYAPSRKVYDDHSIMGDYVNEGLQKAEAKLRHGERLAAMIGAATDKDLKARKR
jgi:hypothetical protein